MYKLKKAVRMNVRDIYFSLRSGVKPADGCSGSVLCNSYPKSGTHLLYQELKKIPGYKAWDDIVSVQSLSGFANLRSHVINKISCAERNSIIRSHIAFDLEVKDFLASRNIKHVLIIRDPRDVCVSHANWVMNEPKIYLHDYYANFLENFDERLMASIKGIIQGVPFGSDVVLADVGREFDRWLTWVDDESVAVVKFEDLYDKNKDSFFKALRKIYNHLDIDITDELIAKRHISDSLPIDSHTYAKGLKKGPGSWKMYFNNEHKEAFNSVAPNLLRELGYESFEDEND